ncbi:krox-like protein, putative [Plasmodium ovale wallikeri]|uniref:Oxidation resistance protein 1 n=1 Tax=Plasmodium ovale wallikeri TaxID=864142 RepID=A0A1A8Z9X8_PLAOA|nr:krox-like protein, putative [Plasmodium ovale wallikeri]
MGEGYSKHALDYGTLSEQEVEKVRKKFNLNKKEVNEKISTLEFINAYPHILRPYIALVLPSFHEILRKKKRKNEGKGNNYGFNYALNILFNKNSKKINNEISLQDIINILSYIHGVKSRVLIRILFMSFLRYSISNGGFKGNRNNNSNNMLTRLKIVEENEDGENDKKEDNYECKRDSGEVSSKQDEDGKANGDYTDCADSAEDGDNADDCENADGEHLGGDRNSFEFVFSDSNVNIINKNKKKERNYKFIKDNIFFLEKNKLKNQYPRNYIMKDLISVEEALHHLFTYMYIEQLYLLCPGNILFQLANKNSHISDNSNILRRSMTNMWDSHGQMGRKNSWDLGFFFNELFCSLETNLDFKNIIVGFRLFVNSIDNNKHSIYSLVVEYINSTYINMSSNYTSATLKHFMESESVIMGDEDKKDKKGEKEKEESNWQEEQNELTNFNDICINSIELIHTIYTNMKKNEIKKQENIEEKIKGEEKYEKSSSIVQIQNSTNGWRGLFLNKTSKILTDEIVFTLRQCSSCFTNNEWYRLYASWKQGTSLNRFISSLSYYPSPIVIVIKTNDNQILGAVCTTTPLKDSHLFQGCSNDFLFSAHPVFRIIKSNQFGTNYVYLNSKNTFYPKGLGFGGRTECFRLFLSDEFKESYCTQSDYTYKSGHLYFPHHQKEEQKEEQKKEQQEEQKKELGMNKKNSSDNNNMDNIDDDDNEDAFLYKLSINEVEAWGCGDEHALEQQKLMQKNEEACKQERRTTDKSKIVQNSFDKEFLLPKVFVGGKYEELTQDK